MAWTKVQSAHADGATLGSTPNWTLAFPSNVTAGNLLVAFFDSDNATMSASDGTGHNTWALVKAQGDSANDQKGAMWYTIASVSEALTVIFTTVGLFRGFIIQEWAHSGGGVLALDQSNSGSQATNNPTTTSITPTANDALILATAGWTASSATTTVTAPPVLEDTCSLDFAAPTAKDHAAASYQQATPASVNVTFNHGVSGDTFNIIASFLAVGSKAIQPDFSKFPKEILRRA